MSTKASKIIDSLKEKTEDAVESIKDVTAKEEETSSASHQLPDENPLTLSIIEQDFSTDKKAVLEMATVEKRWVERKRRIEVPVRYEQIFVNNKELRKNSLGESLEEIKDAILKTVPIDRSKKNEENDSKWIPLTGSGAEVEKTIPLYAEQLIISKKKVKVGEIIIRKREVTTLEKIDVHVIKEKISVENPQESS
jgi:stress response protein YsnF